jgi:glycosyltransferase involved in cell wall biosynthesis
MCDKGGAVPDVSIIIPTHNRAALVTCVIDALLKQDTSAEYEIVLVDSASDAATARALQELPSRERIRLLRTEKPGAAAARNVGLNAATGGLLLLLDDDILVSPDFLATALTGAKAHPGCVLLGQIEAPWTDSADPFHRFLLESGDVNSYAFKDNQDVSPQYFYTACVLIPRVALGQTRFDENFTVYGIEDLEFGIRLLGGGTRMVYLPEWRVRHEYYPMYAEYRRKKFRTGYSLAYFIAKQPENARYFYVEPDGTRRWYRIYRVLAAPFALLAHFFARLLKRKGKISRLLYTWFYRDLRVQLYNGMRAYRKERNVHG